MPEPRKNETKEKFISRCMGNAESIESFPREDQRAAFCNSQWDRRHNMKVASILLSNVATRTEMFEGKEHLVLPVVALIEGVLNNLYYPGIEILKHPQSWNGIPVVIDHPVDQLGMKISANIPQVLEKTRIGHFFNVEVDSNSAKPKLKGEAWVDIEKAKEIRPKILDEVHKNLEISTALFGDDDNIPGKWGGVDFGGTLTGFKPDHLALLFESEGACNWQDGCGVRVNMQEEIVQIDKKGGDKIVGGEDKEAMIKEAIKTAGIKGDKETSIFKKMLNFFLSNFKTNELGHDDIRMQLQGIVDSMDVPTEAVAPILHYIQEVFDDYVIIRQTSGSTSRLFKIGFDISEDDKITLQSDRVEVREQTDFVPAEIGLGSQTTYVEVNSKKEDLKMSEKKKNDCCKELIDALILNEATQFTEDDRKWLDELPEDQIRKLSPVEDDKAKKETEDDKAKKKAGEESKVAAAARESYEKALGNKQSQSSEGDNKPITVEAYINQAPGDMKDVLTAGLTMHKAKKAQLIEGLIANKRNKFTKEQLESKSVDELEKLADLAAVVVDFTVNSPQVNVEYDDEKIPDPPEIDWDAAAGKK